MRILIDLDDTLVDMMSKAVYYYNSLYEPETPVKLADLKSWELPNIEKWRAIWKIPGFYTDLPWMDKDAQEVLGTISDFGHEIVIVSSVPTWESCAGKYQWCHTHLRIPGIIKSMDQVVLTRGKQYVQGDVIIDDNADNLYKSPAGRAIIFARPWNKWCDDYDRARDWLEVEDLIAETNPKDYI